MRHMQRLETDIILEYDSLWLALTHVVLQTVESICTAQMHNLKRCHRDVLWIYVLACLLWLYNGCCKGSQDYSPATLGRGGGGALPCVCGRGRKYVVLWNLVPEGGTSEILEVTLCRYFGAHSDNIGTDLFKVSPQKYLHIVIWRHKAM